MNNSIDIQMAGLRETDNPGKLFLNSQSKIPVNTSTLPSNPFLAAFAMTGGDPITRYDEEFCQTDYPEDADLPEKCPTFYEGDSDTVWIRNNDNENAFFERGYAIRFFLDQEIPRDKEVIVDAVEVMLCERGDYSGLTADLYLDNRKVASIPYTGQITNCFNLKLLNISEKDRTLSFRKNIMVKFRKNGYVYMKMGIGCLSMDKPLGHIKGRLKPKNRILPQLTCQCLTDHNKNVTGLTDPQGNLVASWDYDAFGNIIQQTGELADKNPLRFSSEYHDEDLGLIYYNYRYYNPQDGRWISRDPLGEQEDCNLYKYIGNSSVNFIDNLGLALELYRKDPSKLGFSGLEIGQTTEYLGSVMKKEYAALTDVKFNPFENNENKIEIAFYKKKKLYKPTLIGEFDVKLYYNKTIYNNGKMPQYHIDHEREHADSFAFYWNKFAMITNKLEKYYCQEDCANLMYSIMTDIMRYARQYSIYKSELYDKQEYGKVFDEAGYENKLLSLKEGLEKSVDLYNSKKCQTFDKIGEEFAPNGFDNLDISNFLLY